MSLGYGGFARKVAEDELTVIYEYGAYNLNEEKYRNPDTIYDGIITIDKTALIEPEIHKRIKRHPSGRKEQIIKRIPQHVGFDALFEAGKITVENSRFCWKYIENVGVSAFRLIYKIFNEYQIEGKLPEKTGYNV